MALVPACADVGLGSAVVVPGAWRRAMVRGFSPLAICMVVSSLANCIPSQNEPHTSHGVSVSSITKFGSMAFQLSRFSRDVTMQPSSFHIGDESLLAESSPMADPFLPNVEQLYASHHFPCHLMMSGAHTCLSNPGTES